MGNRNLPDGLFVDDIKKMNTFQFTENTIASSLIVIIR